MYGTKRRKPLQTQAANEQADNVIYPAVGTEHPMRRFVKRKDMCVHQVGDNQGAWDQ
jgi:hypothetical protein